MVSVRHVAAEHADLRFSRHDPVAVSSHDFPYVRILLMRHDARSGCEFVRELDESVVRAHVHAAVGCEFVECQCYGAHCGSYGALGLSTAQLGCNDIIVKTSETEKVSCHLTVQRE